MSRSAGILVAIVFFLFGASAIYVLIGKGIIVANPGLASPSPASTIMVQEVSPTPVVFPDSSVSPNSSPSPSAITTGTIEGTLGYPSEGIPPLDIYAFNANNTSKHTSVSTGQNVSSFSIEVEPGNYYVVAYPKNASSFAGGYTKAVPCGLSVDCTDHSLISVTVTAGNSTSNVEVKDWYAPEGSFPAKPQ